MTTVESLTREWNGITIPTPGKLVGSTRPTPRSPSWSGTSW